MPTGHTHINGPLHFPGQGGKLLKRTRIASGTQKVYWGLGPQDTTTTYHGPTTWPKTGAPVLLPRPVRWICGPAPTGPSDFNNTTDGITAGTAVTAIIRAANSGPDTYYNIDTNANLAFTFPFTLVTGGLDRALPLTADVTSGLFLATDVLTFHLVPCATTTYQTFTGVAWTINSAAVNAQATRFNNAVALFPRYHVRVYIYATPPQASNPFNLAIANSAYNNNLTIYGSLFPGLIDPAYYSYGGTLARGDADPTPYIDFLSDHWSLT